MALSDIGVVPQSWGRRSVGIALQPLSARRHPEFNLELIYGC